MTDGWPPDGYASPREYISHDRRILVTGILLVTPTIMLTRQVITSGSTWAVGLFEGFGLSKYPLALVTVTLLVTLVWVLLSGAAIILVHEGVHYAVGIVMRVNPQFEWHSQFGVPSPGVVAYTARIGRWENILMLGSPFLFLSIVCTGIIWSTGDVLAATAGIMFSINAVASCSDIYKVGRLALMPDGTLFANFKDNGSLHSEFAVPDSER